MDLIYRKKKYREFLSKLQELKGHGSNQTIESNPYTAINDQLVELLSELRGKADLVFTRNAYILLAFPLSLILVYRSYYDGLGITFGLLICVFLFFLISHFIMKNLIKINNTKSRKKDEPSENGLLHIWDKINYVNSIIDIKTYRFILLAGFYVLFFPILLAYLYQVIYFPNASLVVWILSFILSVSYWTIYYYHDIAFYLELKELVNGIKKQLTSISEE